MTQKLPPLPDEVFDGDKFSFDDKPVKCDHQLKAVSSTEVRCTKCSAGWRGAGVLALIESK